MPIEYMIASATTLADLVAQVADLCPQGWIPHGSLVIDLSSERGYIQPLVRRTAPAPFDCL